MRYQIWLTVYRSEGGGTAYGVPVAGRVGRGGVALSGGVRAGGGEFVCCCCEKSHIECVQCHMHVVPLVTALINMCLCCVCHFVNRDVTLEPLHPL